MASISEVEAAVHLLADRLTDVDPELRRRYIVERRVDCRLRDLDVTWSARLCQSGLVDITLAASPRPQVRVWVGSDDLVALAHGTLAVPAAWATGRLRVQATPLDLLRLRSLL